VSHKGLYTCALAALNIWRVSNKWINMFKCTEYSNMEYGHLEVAYHQINVLQNIQCNIKLFKSKISMKLFTKLAFIYKPTVRNIFKKSPFRKHTMK
jgi:hypothetical protein